MSVDRATVGDIVVPLVNDLDPAGADTAPDDDRAFAWRVEALPGPSTPPPNDERAGAIPLALGHAGTADNASAGGLGDTEVPGCPGAAGATRGVWFRFALPNSGIYHFDATATDTTPPKVTVVRTGLTLGRTRRVAVSISGPIREVEGCRGTLPWRRRERWRRGPVGAPTS